MVVDVDQDAIVRCDKKSLWSDSQQRLSWSTDTWIHYDNMDRPLRKVTVSRLKHKGGLSNPMRWNLMGNVHNGGLGVDAQDHPFHAGYERIRRAEIGEQGDDGRGRPGS